MKLKLGAAPPGAAGKPGAPPVEAAVNPGAPPVDPAVKLGAPPVDPLKLKPELPVGAAGVCVDGAPEPPKLNPLVLLELCCE